MQTVTRIWYIVSACKGACSGSVLCPPVLSHPYFMVAFLPFLPLCRTLFTKLPKVPILLVAMVSEGSHDSQLLEEGRGLAEKWKALFVSSSEQSWLGECLIVFVVSELNGGCLPSTTCSVTH